jgi:hypothetical protein
MGHNRLPEIRRMLCCKPFDLRAKVITRNRASVFLNLTFICENGTLDHHIYQAHMAGTRRTHILMPLSLLRDIDALVGPRGRSAFLLETASQEVERRRLLRFLESNEPAWTEKAHPELTGGSSAWVRHLRQQSEGRGKQDSRQRLGRDRLGARQSLGKLRRSK